MSFSEIGETEIAAGVLQRGSRFDRYGHRRLCSDWAARPAQAVQHSGDSRLYGAFLNGENEDVFGLSVGGDARYLALAVGRKHY